MAKPTIGLKAVYQGVMRAGTTVTINTDMDLLKRAVTLRVNSAFMAAAGPTAQEGEYTVTGGINLTDTVQRLGYDTTMMSSLSVVVPEGVVISGGFGDEPTGYGIQTGNGLEGMPVTVVNSGYIFGADASADGSTTAQPAILNERSVTDPITVINNVEGWVSPGGQYNGAGDVNAYSDGPIQAPVNPTPMMMRSVMTTPVTETTSVFEGAVILDNYGRVGS